MGLRAISGACRNACGDPGDHVTGVSQASRCLAASIATLLLVALPDTAQQARSDTASAIQEVVKEIGPAGRSRVILRLVPAPGPRAGIAGRFAAASAAVRTALPEEQRLTLNPLSPDLSVAELSADELQGLVEQGLVADAVLDRLMPVALVERTRLINATALEAEPLAEDPPARRHTVAVLDTGFDLDHPFIQDSIVRQACFSSTVPGEGTTSLCPNGRRTQTVGDAADACDPASLGPLCDHGTMVTGIIAGGGAEIMGQDGTLRAPLRFLRISLRRARRTNPRRYSCSPLNPACCPARWRTARGHPTRKPSNTACPILSRNPSSITISCAVPERLSFQGL